MIDPKLINDKVIEALSLLTDNSVGDILTKIGKKEDLDPLIILAFEEFYDKYSKIVLEIDNGKSLDDTDILKKCLVEAEGVLKRSKTDEERANAIIDVIDLRRSIKRLKKEKKNDSESDATM